MDTQVQNLKQNSFEISKTSAGKYSWTVKVYEENIDDLNSKTDDALKKIKIIISNLEKENI